MSALSCLALFDDTGPGDVRPSVGEIYLTEGGEGMESGLALVNRKSPLA